MAQFKKRKVGRTSLEVTELGIGTATIAGMHGTVVTDEQARGTMRASLDAGVGYFDTAPHYGAGRAEHMLGDALRFQDGYALSTKVGRLLVPVRNESERIMDNPWTQPFPFEIRYDYSYGAIIRSFEDSLQRLGLSKIDILLVHDIGTQTHGVEGNKPHWRALAEGGHRALMELKSKGLISAIGLGVNEYPVIMDALEIGDWDVFLIANRYNLIEQTVLSPMFTACAQRGASVIAAGPFAAGVLAGTDVWGPPNGDYQKPPTAIVEKVNALREVARDNAIPLGAAALQFALAHPVVCSVLTGPKTPDELKGNLDWWNTKVPDAFWNALADRKLVAAGTPLPNGRTA